MKLGVVTTHPIQYIAPWFRQLARDPALDLEVLFLRVPAPEQQGAGFGRAFAWDIDLRGGYRNTVLDVPTGWIHVAQAAARIAAALRRWRPAAVLITGWNEPALRVAYFVALAQGIPIIVRGESNALRHRSALVRLAHVSWLKMAAAVLVIGRSNRAFYLEHGVPEWRLHGGAYFVDNERLTTMAARYQPARAALRQAAGFGEDDFVFGFVGKHVMFKRPRLLIEAAAILRREGLPIKLLMAGSGELTESLRTRAQGLDVPVHFTGFLNQTELWRAYLPLDALVLPSDQDETWGLVANEAFLFGLPVIVSDQVGCGPDLIHTGQTGFVFADGERGLAEIMRVLQADRAKARTMGRRGRELVLRDYSMAVATRGLKAALDRLRGAR